APVVLIQVKGHSGNRHNNAADMLAKQGALLPEVPAYVPLPSQPMLQVGPSYRIIDPSIAKVLHQPIQKPEKSNACTDGTDHMSALTAHCNRPALLALQLEHHKKLLEAETEREFWRVAKDVMNPKRVSSGFSAEALKNVFIARMNPVQPVPESFDEVRLEYNHALAAAIPDRTPDETPDRIFSQPFNEEEMAEAKDHLQQYPLTSSKGYD
ncbi:hypothetical protein DFH08DRAFT_713712, partial [Mycena albidolilacea]